MAFLSLRSLSAEDSVGDLEHVIYFVFAVSAALAVAALVEYLIHFRRVKAIPLRILVNGTRGKSTVTRLIAAGLAAGGVRTYAKTTGSAARLILPDMSELPIRQKGPAKARASIMEHRWFLREAHRDGARALVAECMAIQPETIRTLETRLAHSTIGVITNVRLDHMDTMGTELASVAGVLAESIPEKGRLFVGSEGMDESVGGIFALKAARRGAELRLVGGDEETRSMCGEFPYPVFEQNLALALAVCGACGVPREVALCGMRAAVPDPGVRPSLEFAWRGAAVRVVNAFAANDVQSTLEMWWSGGAPADPSDLPGARTKAAHDAYSLPARSGRPADASSGVRSFRALVFNHREDRAWRAFQLGEIAAGMDADAIFVYGMGERLAKRTVSDYYRRNVPRADRPRLPAVQSIREASAGALLEAIRAVGGSDAAGPERIEILCAGNIKGPGLALTESLAAMPSRQTEKAFLGRA